MTTVTSGIFYTLAAAAGAFILYTAYTTYKAPSESSSYVPSLSSPGDPVNPTTGGRRTHKRKHHGKKTKKHYLKK